MAATFLIFLTYVHFSFREECRQNALWKAQYAAENIAAWADEYYASADGADTGDMSVWEQGIRTCLGSGEDVVILDEQKRVIFSSNQTLDSLCQDALDRPVLSGGGSQVFAVGISASKNREWNCFVFRDVAEEMENNPVPPLCYILFFLLSGICFAAAAYFIYRPIDRCLKALGEETGQKSYGKKELDFLSASVNLLREDSRKLQDMMRRKQDRLQKIFLLRFLRGDILLPEEYEEYVKDFGLRPLRSFVVIVSILDLRNEDSQNNLEEDAICLKLVEEMPESLKKLTWIPPAYNACAIVAILNGDDENQLFMRIEEYYTELKNFSKAACGYQLLAGVSATHTNPQHICMAYQESIRALTRPESDEVKEHFGDSGAELAECRFYLAGLTTEEIPYDASYEKKVQLGIKNMDKSLCYQAADEFCRYLTGENYHQDEIMVCVLQFVNSILLTAMEIRVDMETLYPNGFRRLYEELMEIPEPSRERRYIKKNLIDPILENRSKLMEKRSYSLLENIEQLIREKKGDISLAECAEILGVHTTYIWKVLKAERGKTFSDFLEEYKLEEAKRLLLNTNMTVAEIASSLNYTNAQNFIRFFSKSTGMTPGKFRKLYERT